MVVAMDECSSRRSPATSSSVSTLCYLSWSLVKSGRWQSLAAGAIFGTGSKGAHMHGLGVMQAVVDEVTERLGDLPVTSIHLAVGRISGVEPDALRLCFELATSVTTMDGAVLTIEEPPG